MADGNVLSPWFPREADNAIFTREQIQNSASVGLTVEVWHKNTEDIGEGDKLTVSGGSWGTSGDLSYGTFEGLKELVRFEFTAGSAGTVLVGTVQEPGGPGADVNTSLTSADIGWIMFRMLAPTWFNTADA
jgi:hypothetical protein